MSIERGLRARQNSSSPRLELIPLFESEVDEQGILTTKERPGHIKIDFSQEKNFPKVLVLRAKISPILLMNKECHAQMVLNDQAMEKTNYYDLGHLSKDDQELALCAQYQAIELQYFFILRK